MDSITYNQERKRTDTSNNIKLNGIANTDEVINEVYEIIELYNSIKKKTNRQINELKIKEQDASKKVENDLRLYSKYVTKVNEINDESLRIKYNKEIFKLSNKIQTNEQLLLNVTEEVDTLENEIIEIENNLLTNYIPSDPNVLKIELCHKLGFYLLDHKNRDENDRNHKLQICGSNNLSRLSTITITDILNPSTLNFDTINDIWDRC